MIPLQFDVSQSLLFGEGKVLPNSEVPLGLPPEGVLSDVPVSFSAFVSLLSGTQDATMNANPAFIEEPSDLPGEEPVTDAKGGVYQQSPTQQVHEMPENIGSFPGDTGIDPDDVVPSPDAIPGDMLPGDVTGQDVSKETITDSLYLQVGIDPAGDSGDISGFREVETAGEGFVSGSIGPPMLEGTPMVSSTAEGTDEPKTVAAGINNATPLVERHVLIAGRDSEVSQKVAIIIPAVENEKGPQAGVRDRMSLASTETSEKISTNRALLLTGQDHSGNFLEGRDSGHSAPSDGSKPGMPDPRFEHVGVQRDSNVSSIKPEITAPGAFQKSDPDILFQVEKMTWPLTGTPGTGVSEKGEIMEASRLPLEPREIRTLTDIIEKAVWRQENGQSQARIQLKPAFLGHLHLNVIMDQLKVTVEIRAETLLARDFLETNLHVLKADLQQGGLQVDKIDVLVDPNLNNQQEQGHTSAQKQMHRMNGHSEEMVTLTDDESAEPKKVIPSGREENQIDCFV